MAIKKPDPEIRIISGPNLRELDFGLTDYRVFGQERKVSFTFQKTYPRGNTSDDEGNILVDGLIREDETGENWTILGRVATIQMGKWNGFIKLHYSTQTRQGTVLELEMSELLA